MWWEHLRSVLGKFQVHNTLSFTIVVWLYIRFPEFHRITERPYPVANICLFSQSADNNKFCTCKVNSCLWFPWSFLYNHTYLPQEQPLICWQVSAPVPLPTCKENQRHEGPEEMGACPHGQSQKRALLCFPQFLLQFSMDRKVALPLPQEGDLVCEDQFCVSLKSLLKSWGSRYSFWTVNWSTIWDKITLFHIQWSSYGIGEGFPDGSAVKNLPAMQELQEM